MLGSFVRLGAPDMVQHGAGAGCEARSAGPAFCCAVFGMQQAWLALAGAAFSPAPMHCSSAAIGALPASTIASANAAKICNKRRIKILAYH
ncbi:MAG: hypothetical protein ACE14L_15940 [Terriglobales bacterium]